MKILGKFIEPGTWRYLGQRCSIEAPHRIPIAGHSMIAIQRSIGAICYTIGRICPQNAFLAVVGNMRFLYVRPTYKGYRKAAMRVFSEVPWSVDFDHALARNIALKASPTFCYVLLLRVPPDVNRRHGSFEKRSRLPTVVPEVCFADDRIGDKWIGRSPMQNRDRVGMMGYSPLTPTKPDLSLKRLGRWAYATGMGDFDLPLEGLTRIEAP